MRFPLLKLFRREKTSAAARERQDQLEKLFSESLRTLSALLKTAADQIEAKRLERSGYERQEKFLRRHEDDRKA